jgi:DNA excision repair protein ERCC-3
VHLEVANRVRVDAREVSEDLVKRVLAMHVYENPKRALLERIGRYARNVPAEVKTARLSGHWLDFPRGSLARVRALFRAEGYEVFHRDLLSRGDKDWAEAMPEYRGDLRPYQRRARDAMVERTQCLLRSATGSGKTEIMLATFAANRAPALAIVPTGGIFEQWVERVKLRFGVPERDVGIVRGKERRLRPITVAMYQTLAKQGVDKELDAFFGQVGFDETHKSAAETCFRVVDAFRARNRYGVSDDERRKDRLEPLIYDLFGREPVEIDEAELLDQGHVVDVQVRVVPTEFRADWYGLDDGNDAAFVPDEPAQRKEIDVARLHREMAADEERNQIAIDLALRELEAGEQVLLFAHLREHCFALARAFSARGIPTGFFLGGQEHRKEFRDTREAIVSGKCRVGVGTYGALSTGIDLPALAVGICVTPIGANRTLVRQTKGRLCRPAEGKEGGRLYYLFDGEVLPNHLKNLSRWVPNVVVRDGQRWVEVREWMRRRAA